MAVPLIRGLVGRPKALPLQSNLEEKGSKAYYNPDQKTYFSAYKTPLGIEVEVEGFNVMAWPTPRPIYWSLKEDGSLRDNGKELVSCPIAGKNIDFALRELEKIMSVQAPRWSHRCSVHVHINVRNWTFLLAHAFVATYAVFEQLFFSLVPPERKACGFAYPITDCLPSSINFADHDGKYCAFNVGSSIATFGTVEFRHMDGTADSRRLRRWLQLIVKLHQYIRRKGADDVIATIQMLNTNSEYQKFLSDVFGMTAAVFPPTVLQQSMEEGVLWAKVYIGAQL